MFSIDHILYEYQLCTVAPLILCSQETLQRSSCRSWYPCPWRLPVLRLNQFTTYNHRHQFQSLTPDYKSFIAGKLSTLYTPTKPGDNIVFNNTGDVRITYIDERSRNQFCCGKPMSITNVYVCSSTHACVRVFECAGALCVCG